MAKQQKTKIEIPKQYKPRERLAIAQEIIDFIIERTQSGYDKDGKRFVGYSKSYRKSLDFKNAGKTSLVNLTSSEEMLGSLDLLTEKSGEITLGYDKSDKDLNGKVEGNRLGTYGNKKSVTKGRDFLGISQTALNNILKKYPINDRERRMERAEIVLGSQEKAEELA